MPDIFVSPRERSSKEYSSVMAEHKPTRHALSAFMVRPKKLRFETQDAEEKVLLLLRPHWITNVPWLAVAVVMSLAPMVAGELMPALVLVPLRFQVMMVVMWYLLTLAMIIEKFLSWYFNIYIVTDERIVDIDFYSLIYKEISDTKIERIQDVTVTQGGVIRALFNFGTVYIQTAGEKREFDFENVPQPQLVAKFLNEMLLEEERERMEGRVR